MCPLPIVGAPVMDIVVWLRSLGLGKYEAAFRENEIDETVLPSLTHETLKELGVTAVGHRLKLLDAFAGSAIWPGRRRGNFVVSVPGFVDAWLSRGCARRR